MDQQHRTTSGALKDARSSYKPAIFLDTGFLVDTSPEALGVEGWALATESSWARGQGKSGTSSSKSMCCGRTNAPTGRVDRNWTKSGGKAP